MAFTIENNQPSAGCIRWTSLNMQYKGVNYAITNGYTNYIYIYWTPTSPNSLVVSNTFPTLGIDDCLVFLNKSGISVTVPTSTVIPGDLIIPGSIVANAIAANTITGNNIAADTITGTNIAASTITASEIAANAIGANAIAAAVITGDKLVADTITAREIASRTITANEITAGTITANEIATNTITAAKIAAGAITADKISATGITADTIKGGTLTLGGSNNINGALTLKDVNGNIFGAIDKDGINTSTPISITSTYTWNQLGYGSFDVNTATRFNARGMSINDINPNPGGEAWDFEVVLNEESLTVDGFHGGGYTEDWVDGYLYLGVGTTARPNDRANNISNVEYGDGIRFVQNTNKSSHSRGFIVNDKVLLHSSSTAYNYNPTISVAIGDADTGLNWRSDGNFDLVSNGSAKLTCTTTGIVIDNLDVNTYVRSGNVHLEGGNEVNSYSGKLYLNYRGGASGVTRICNGNAGGGTGKLEANIIALDSSYGFIGANSSFTPYGLGLEYTGNIYQEWRSTNGGVVYWDLSRDQTQDFNVRLATGGPSYMDVSFAGDSGTFKVNGSLTANSKSAITSTPTYGEVYTYCDESPNHIFIDRGEGIFDANGECYVMIDDIFLETVNTKNGNYWVQLTAFEGSEAKLKERQDDHFIIVGTPNTMFLWRVEAERLGYENLRWNDAYIEI